jgi:hypothetical protein
MSRERPAISSQRAATFKRRPVTTNITKTFLDDRMMKMAGTKTLNNDHGNNAACGMVGSQGVAATP